MKMYFSSIDGAVSSDLDATETKYIERSGLTALPDASHGNTTSNTTWSSYDTASTDHYQQLPTLSMRSDSVSEFQCLVREDEYSHSSSTCDYVNTRVQNRKLPPTPSSTTFRSSRIHTTGCSCDNCSVRGKPLGTPFNRCLVTVSVVSVTFSVLSCGLAALGFVHNPVSWMHREADVEICIPCDLFVYEERVDTPWVGEMWVRTLSDGSELCCSRDRDQISAVVNMINQQKNNSAVQALTRPSIRHGPVSAHKHLHAWRETGTEGSKSTDKHQLRVNANTDVSTEHVVNVIAMNNSLQILISGRYLVYSGVYFRSRNGKPCGQRRHQTWGHFIVRHNPNSLAMSGILAQSAHTCCDNCTEDHHTSQAAGVFWLQAGDQVHVEVSGSELALYDGEGSYLGLLMLGSWNSGLGSVDGSDNRTSSA